MARQVVAGALLVLLCAGCADDADEPTTNVSRVDEDEVTPDELQLARAAAVQNVQAEEVTVSSATVSVRTGTVEDSNTGHECTSSRLLRVQVNGEFPHITTTGHPVEPGETEDFTIRGMTMTVDGVSGDVCLISVQTKEVEPRPNSVPLDLG